MPFSFCTRFLSNSLTENVCQLYTSVTAGATHICTRHLVLRAAPFPQPENGPFPPYASSEEQGNGRCLLLPTFQSAVLLPAQRGKQRCCTWRCCAPPTLALVEFLLLLPPVHPVVQPRQPARHHTLYQVSPWHNSSFSRASGKAGGREWLSCVAMLVVPAYSTVSPTHALD